MQQGCLDYSLQHSENWLQWSDEVEHRFQVRYFDEVELGKVLMNYSQLCRNLILTMPFL